MKKEISVLWQDPTWRQTEPGMNVRHHQFCHGLHIVTFRRIDNTYNHEIVDLADLRIYRNKARTRYYAAVWLRICYGEPDANGVYPVRYVRGQGDSGPHRGKVDALRNALEMAGFVYNGEWPYADWDCAALARFLADELADNFGGETFVVESYDD